MMIYILVGVFINMIVGAVVWTTIDDKNHQLYNWYNDCPQEIAWFAQPLILTLWPVGLWLWVVKMR